MSSDEKYEKAAPAEASVLPQYSGESTSRGRFVGEDGAVRDSDFYTRNGLNFESFKRRGDNVKVAELDRSMKKRHLHMIAIGGSIGAGFFVGSGGAFGKGGPASVLIDFMIIGVMMFNVVYALGEMAIMYPVNGSFYKYSTRFIDPSWGFAMGWNYVFQWIIVLPFELTVCGFVMGYWPGARDVSVGVWITIFWLAIIICNIWGTLGYAEEEFWASCLKLAGICIFMVVALILICGGGPSSGRYSEYWGTQTWSEGRAFRNGFKGFCGVFVTAAFSFAGTELVGLAAAEAKNPVKDLPGAVKQVFWRITLFFILGLSLVGLLVYSDDPRMIGADNAYREGASPFVLAAEYAGLWGFNHFLNAIILVSVMSIGVSCVYGGSRTLCALAEEGYAPQIFTYVDKGGRPLPAVAVHLIAGALAYVNLSPDGSKVFNWLLAASALSALFTWGSVCLAHIRFRAAWKAQGHTLDEIPFLAVFGTAGSWVGLVMCILVLAASIFVAIAPPGKDDKLNDAEGFFMDMLTLPVIIFFWIVGYFWKRTGWLKLSQIDVDSNRREHNWEVINAYRAELAARPMWRQILDKIF